jgi:hypothetical protein
MAIFPGGAYSMVKFRNAADIRFYLYISTTKINMLYEQMFAVPKRVSKNKISLKAVVLSGSRESSVEEILDREDKLRAVEDKLTKFQLVGTPNDPKDYFKGTLRMRWGLYNDLGTRPEEEAPLVYFGGIDKGQHLIVGLGGSSKHVVGHDGATSTYSRSSTPTLVRWLLAGLEHDSPPEIPLLMEKRSEESELFSAIAVALHQLKPPTQELEFLAKTLATGTLYGHEHITGLPEAKVILGTPLYVVQTHPLPEEINFGLDKDW